MSIRTKVTPNGNLLITADNEARRELAEQFALGGYGRAECHVLNEICPNSELEWIPPEAIGALTDAPIIAEAYLDDNSEWQIVGNVWWFPDYMITDPWEELRRRGRVIFTLAPVEAPETAPRPLDAVAARVVAEMAAPVRKASMNVRELIASIVARIRSRSMAAFVHVAKGR